MNGIDYVPWSHREHAEDLIKDQRAVGAQIVVLELAEGAKDFRDADYRFPLCLVLGHEREGVSSTILDEADAAIEIPMFGFMNSLNVATAFGIVAYELADRYLRLDNAHPLEIPAREGI